MRRHVGIVIALLVLGPAALVAVQGPAHALTDTWAAWDPITGTTNNYATTLRQQAPGFPEAAVATDSRGNVQLPSGLTTFLGTGTPPGLKYGTSRGSSYLALRPRADTPTAPSTTTYTFADPTPDTGWAFVLGDVDSDQVEVRATDEDGAAVPAAEIDSWFQGTFNYAGDADLPTWDALSSTLTGNPAAADTNGASGWFEPDVRLTSLTLVFTRRAGFPIYQTWFVSRARPIGGTVDDVSTLGSCSVEQTTLTLVSPFGVELGPPTSPAADGSYSFGEYATQAGYVVRLSVPETCAVVGPAEQTVSNRGNDNDPASRADFDVRQIVPQPISGTVRDGDGNPVAGVELTLTRPGGGTATTTTGPDGTYLFDANPIGTDYSVTVTVPPGYVAGPGGTTIDDIDIDTDPVVDQDFVIVALASVSGQVTGGGGGLGGVQVTLTPVGGGPAITTVTDGDGRYLLDGVPPGDYVASIVAPDGYDGDTSQAVTVAAADVTGVDFALTRPGAIAGTVTDADSGEPVGDVTIEVDGPVGPVLETETDDAGGYLVDGLESGDYEVVVVPPPGTEVVGDGVRDVTITDAGEIRGGQDFQLQAEETGPTEPPTSTESPSATASPTTVPTAVEGGSTSPASGDAALWVALVGTLLLAAGSGLVLATGRHRRH